VLLLFTAAGCSGNDTSSPGVNFVWMGTFPGDDPSEGFGISGDGTIVVGYSGNTESMANSMNRAFIYKVNEKEMSTVPGIELPATGVSLDGTHISGTAD